MLPILDRLAGPPRGSVNLWRVWQPDRRRRRPPPPELLVSRSNQIQIPWGYVAAQCIGKGNRAYRIQAIYFEYENVLDSSESEGSIAPPEFSRDDGVEYYLDLAMSSSRDFLRVPLLMEPDIKIAPGFENSFTEGVDGNQLTFYTQTQGNQGVHGKPFSHAAGSTILGVALAATPVFADVTQDIVFARTYFDPQDQAGKLPSSQFGLGWNIHFE